MGLREGAAPFILANEPVELIGLISFHADGIEYDLGQKAWQAWANASNPFSRSDSWDSIDALLISHNRSMIAAE